MSVAKVKVYLGIGACDQALVRLHRSDCAFRLQEKRGDSRYVRLGVEPLGCLRLARPIAAFTLHQSDGARERLITETVYKMHKPVIR